MTGDSETLVEAMLRRYPFSQLRRRVVQEAVRFLLYRQTVRARALGERLWRVQCGTGMGLGHSGDLSSVCFHNLAEEQWVTPERLAGHGILSYMRTHDDILIVGKWQKRDDVKRWFWSLCQDAEPFRIEVDQISRSGLGYLDVWISLTANGLVAVEPWTKPTSGPPLAYDSDHPRAILESWPLGVANRVRKLASTSSTARKAICELAEKCADALALQSCTNRLQFRHCPQKRDAGARERCSHLASVDFSSCALRTRSKNRCRFLTR